MLKLKGSKKRCEDSQCDLSKLGKLLTACVYTGTGDFEYHNNDVKQAQL